MPEPWVPEGDGLAATPVTPETVDGKPTTEMTLIQALNGTLKEMFRENPDTYHLGAGRRLQGEGRHLQRHEGHAAGVRAEAGLQRPHRGGLHPRHGRRLLALSTRRSASSSKAPSSPTTSGPRPSRWSRCRTSSGARTASSSRTSPCASPPAATSAAASTIRRTSRAGSRRCPASASSCPRSRTTRRGSSGRRCARAGSRSTSSRSSSTTRAQAKARVPAEFAVPFGKARRRRDGSDLTIVAYGTPVHFALEAAETLAKEGKERRGARPALARAARLRSDRGLA